ncbi:hypothetical protein ES703_15527 [subsurface metagenome]
MPATGCKGAYQGMDGGIKLGRNKMTESVMRQGMETWLKTECYEGGLALFGFYDYLGQVHERTINIASQIRLGEEPDPLAVKYLKEDVMRYTEYLKEVSDKHPQVLSHDDMWRLRGEMLDIVDKAIQEKGWPFTTATSETLRKVFDDTRKTLLEGIVKCQIGKPEEVKWTRFNKGQIVTIKPEFRHIYLGNVTVTVGADDPKYRQIWVKEVDSAVSYDHIEGV